MDDSQSHTRPCTLATDTGQQVGSSANSYSLGGIRTAILQIARASKARISRKSRSQRALLSISAHGSNLRSTRQSFDRFAQPVPASAVPIARQTWWRVQPRQRKPFCRDSIFPVRISRNSGSCNPVDLSRTRVPEVVARPATRRVPRGISDVLLANTYLTKKSRHDIRECLRNEAARGYSILP